MASVLVSSKSSISCSRVRHSPYHSDDRECEAELVQWRWDWRHQRMDHHPTQRLDSDEGVGERRTSCWNWSLPKME